MSRPTKRWVESRLRTWVDRLGLGHWRVSIDWDTPADEGNWAQVTRASDYDRATVYFCPEWQDMGQVKLDEVICHEVIHMAVRDMSRAHDFVLEAVEDNIPANNIAVASWKRAEEGCVDRMALALVAAFGDT